MEQSNSTASAQAMPPVAPVKAEIPSDKPKAKEHWLVEVSGGLALASTMVAALSLWYLLASQLMA